MKTIGCINTNFEIDFSEELMAAQCFVFYAAGFEATSNTLSFILYELAQHPIIQKKLQEEIDRVLEQQENGTITYDSLHEMQYMDQVINGTYPFSIICYKSYPF